MTAPKVEVRGAVRVDTYRVISEAVERGVAYGVQRAHKYTDSPSEEQIEDQVEQAVMVELCEVLRFDEVEG